ncbi:MAG TPA: 4'-phosphopantetheinyl transferase superfamily protein [Verrucomicrobiae bacterium]|nr:4'-phosphopantetheinyl transferase superfamily protein [Verrucomicrobiae bacterium]
MIELILLDGSIVDTPMTSPQRVLSRPEMEHYHKLRSDSRRREFLLGRILIKAVLTETNHGFISDFPLINPHLSVTGKPAVVGAEFNLAHDGQAVLLAVGDQVVGVDIERIQSFDAAMMTACFTGAERRRIVRSRHPDRVATLLWCLKEAAAKATGAGLVSELEGSRKTRLFYRGGFLHIAGRDRAYAVCSPRPIEPVKVSPALPRFDHVFAALKTGIRSLTTIPSRAPHSMPAVFRRSAYSCESISTHNSE